jgi:putative CocE/NonD family hydrolase
MYLAYEHTEPRFAYLSTGLGHNSPASVRETGSGLHGLIQPPIESFLRRHVFGEKVPDPARVRLMTNLGTPGGYRRAEVLVRDEDDWPLPSTRWTRLHLGDGALSLEPADSGEDVTPLATVNGPKGELRTMLAEFGAASRGDTDMLSRLMAPTMDDLSADEATGVTYTTEPLARDTEITGPIVATLRATALAPNFDWQLRLTDVHPDGRSAWISDGQLRASLRRVDEARSVRNADGDLIRPWLSFTEHEQVPPGEEVEYVVELAPTSNVFRAGHRIRLTIQPVASGYVDSARTAGVGALTIHHKGSKLLLPVIPSRCHKSEPATEVERPHCGAKLEVQPR